MVKSTHTCALITKNCKECGTILDHYGLEHELYFSSKNHLSECTETIRITQNKFII